VRHDDVNIQFIGRHEMEFTRKAGSDNGDSEIDLSAGSIS